MARSGWFNLKEGLDVIQYLNLYFTSGIEIQQNIKLNPFMFQKEIL